MRKDIEIVTQALSRKAVTAQETGDYVSLKVITAIALDLAASLKNEQPKFDAGTFLRNVFQDDTAAALVESVLGVLGILNNPAKAGESE